LIVFIGKLWLSLCVILLGYLSQTHQGTNILSQSLRGLSQNEPMCQFTDEIIFKRLPFVQHDKTQPFILSDSEESDGIFEKLHLH
jgi:hypothetical protein